MAKLPLILLAAPLVAATIVAPAAAQEEKQSVSVRYDDLNLVSASGRERLETRVRSAVRQICGVNGRMTLTEQAHVLACKAEASRDADVKLAALFSGQGGRLADRGRMDVAAP